MNNKEMKHRPKAIKNAFINIYILIRALCRICSLYGVTDITSWPHEIN